MKAMGLLDVRAIVELMRLEILYDEGGVAVDADSYCVRALPEELLANDAFSCWVDESTQPGVLSTSFVGATPKNPTIGLLLRQIETEPACTEGPVETSVGNQRFSQSWRTRNFADIRVYPSHYFLSAQRAAAGDSVDQTVIGLHERASTRSLADPTPQRPVLAQVGAVPAPASAPTNATLRVIVFSKDRPLQLHAALASLHARCTDPQLLEVRVLACASDAAMQRRYDQVAREIPFATFVAENGFQRTLCEMVRGASHVAFVCDDALFVRPWSAGRALGMLQKIPSAIGVSLRLGNNTTSCYALRRPQPVPALADLGENWCACDWTGAQLDFAYPLELSSSIYRVQDLWPLLTGMVYRTPNQLEEQLAARAMSFAGRLPILVLPRTSIAFCAPLNVVQSTHANRHGGQLAQSAQALAARFDLGQRVDIEALRDHTPPACHEEIELPLNAATPADAPTVSVIIPCYRQAQFLPMAAASVAVQTYTDWEIVVVNDGSPDDTSAVVAALIGQLPSRRIRLIEQDNAGLANARNAGIRAARGRYLLALDADDALDPGFLAKTVQLLDADPAVSIVHSDVAIFGARAGIWSTARPFDIEHLQQENGLSYASLYRREVWQASGGYRANMSAGYEDWDFWLGAAAAGFRARHIAEPLMFYREKSAPSMLAGARRHDGALRAQLVLNHAGLYRPEELAAARQTLSATPLPPAKPATAARELPVGAWTSPPAAPSAPPPAATAAPADARATLPAAPADPADSLQALRAAGLWRDGDTLRLHLGCGERRIEGYINVDLAPAAGSLMRSRADIFGDVAELRFPSDSVDEVRSHHMFEHFPRVEALALLIRWHEWLRHGGRLLIETPDIEGSARLLLSDQPLAVKMGVIRHLAGDQAQDWAFHLDHWFPERFRHTLGRLGFEVVQIEQQSWPQAPYLSNLFVLGVKSTSLSREELLDRADELLAQSLVAPSEQALLQRWRSRLRAILSRHASVHVASSQSASNATQTVSERTAPEPKASVGLDPMTWIAACGSRAPLAEIVDFNQRQRDRWVAKLAATVPAGARVLDVGAGTCPYRARFAHCDYRTHDFKRYEGEKLGGGSAYGHIDYASDITAIPAPDASFDVILCTEVLEHVPQPIEAVREMTRLLKPGGRLFLSAPLGSGRHQLPYHYYGGFTPEWYQDVARRLKLEVVSITPNGGFFRLMAQEMARAAGVLAQSGGARPPGAVLNLLGEHLPRWFTALDDSHFHDQFTVGYFVETRRAKAAA
jgi:SAM-dependent methyltransferase